MWRTRIENIASGLLNSDRVFQVLNIGEFSEATALVGSQDIIGTPNFEMSIDPFA